MARYGEKGGFGFWIFLIILILLILLYIYRDMVIEYLKGFNFF